MGHHLVIMHPSYIAAILAGKKTVECRLSKHRIRPFGVIHRGDTLWLKRSGGPLVARARVRRVRYFNAVTRQTLRDIRNRYGDAIMARAGFFARHRSANYATIVLLGRVSRIDPFTIAKRDRRGWVLLDHAPRPMAS